MGGDSREQRQKNENELIKVFTRDPKMIGHLERENPTHFSLLSGYIGWGRNKETYSELSNRLNMVNSNFSPILRQIEDWAGVKDKQMAKLIELHGHAPYARPAEYETYYLVKQAVLKKNLLKRLSAKEKEDLLSHFRISNEKKPTDVETNSDAHRRNLVQIRTILEKLGIRPEFDAQSKIKAAKK